MYTIFKAGKVSYEGPPSYNVLECEFSDSISSANHKEEYTFWQQILYTDTKAKKEITVNINSQRITGEYKYSLNQVPNNYASHFYQDADGNHFAVDSSGVPVLCLWNIRQTDSKSVQNRTEQQCVDVAKKFLSQYVNVEDYTVTVVNKASKKAYEITFIKHLNGYETTDCAIVTVLNTGELYSFSSFMLGKVHKTAAVKFEYDLVWQAVQQKLETIYSDVKENYSSITYEEPVIQYTILEDGKPALYCVVDVSFNELLQGGGYMEQGERVTFLVEL